MFFQLFFAFRIFFPRHKRKIHKQIRAAILGVAMSLIPFILVLHIADGMIEGITVRYVEIATGHLQIKTNRLVDEDTLEQIGNTIRNRPSVLSAFPRIEGVALLASPNGKFGIGVQGIDPDSIYEDEIVRNFFDMQAEMEHTFDRSSIILTKGIAEKLQVGLNQPVKLLITRIGANGSIYFRPKTLIVSDIITSGYKDLDDTLAYIHFDMAYDLFSDTTSPYFTVKIEDYRNKLSDIRADLKQILPGGWYIRSWKEIERYLFESFDMTRNSLMMIMIIIVIVASVNISSSLVMIILEKESEIAYLKAAGGSNISIAASLLILGGLIGLSGGITGIICGLILSLNINSIIHGLDALINGISNLFNGSESIQFHLLNPDYYLGTFPVTVKSMEMLLLLSITLGLSVVAALIPANKSLKMKPVEILQKQ